MRLALSVSIILWIEPHLLEWQASYSKEKWLWIIIMIWTLTTVPQELDELKLLLMEAEQQDNDPKVMIAVSHFCMLITKRIGE